MHIQCMWTVQHDRDTPIILYGVIRQLFPHFNGWQWHFRTVPHHKSGMMGVFSLWLIRAKEEFQHQPSLTYHLHNLPKKHSLSLIMNRVHICVGALSTNWWLIKNIIAIFFFTCMQFFRTLVQTTPQIIWTNLEFALLQHIKTVPKL